MTPTPELVALSSQFHKQGGAKGHVWAIDDQLVCGSFVGRIYKIEDDKLFVEGHVFFLSLDCIPILTESELWAWLWKDKMQLRQNCNSFYLAKYNDLSREEEGLCHERYWEVILFIPEEIQNLYHALYTAAVWVAERMER